MKTEGLREDIAAAAADLSGIGLKKPLTRLGDQLSANERVLAIVSGTLDKGAGVLALTSQRLIFARDTLGQRASVDFPLRQVSSIGFKSSLAMGTVVIAGTGALASEIGNVAKKKGQDFVDAARSALAASQGASVAASAGPGDVADQLTKLASLKDQGILTDEEFAAQKAKLLS